MNKAPCAGCGERHVGCHAKCEEYSAWSENHYGMVKQAYENRQRENMLNSYVVQAKKNMQTKRRKRRKMK